MGSISMGTFAGDFITFWFLLRIDGLRKPGSYQSSILVCLPK